MKISKPKLNIANCYFRDGDYDSALTIYEEICREHPIFSRLLKVNIDLCKKRIGLIACDSALLDLGISFLSDNRYLNRGYVFSYSKKSNYAIVVHVYYINMWERLCDYIDNAVEFCDIFISTTTENVGIITELARKKYPNSSVIGIDNNGMDVLPFLVTVSQYRLWNYDAVLKIHTKNDKTEEREIQGKMLLDGVLGSSALVSDIIKSFEYDLAIGMVGSEILYRSGDYLMYDNRDQFNDLLSRLSLNGPNIFGFVAGTMFWIRGDLLRVLADNIKIILELFSISNCITTGSDGSYAHTFERFFGALPFIGGLKTVLTYVKGVEPFEFGLKSFDPNFINLAKYTSGSTQQVLRYKELSAMTLTVQRSPLFNVDYYKSQLPVNEKIIELPAIHYVLYGDMYWANPSEKFNARYYLARYNDILRLGMCSLVHFTNHGRQEGRVGIPADLDWIDLGINKGLINSLWQQNKDQFIRIIESHDFDHNPSLFTNDFKPDQIPVLAHSTNSKNKIDVLVTYLDGFYQEEITAYDLMERVWSNNDFLKAKEIASLCLDRFGLNKASLEVLASCETLLGNWESAGRFWSLFWDQYVVKPDLPQRCKNSVLRIDSVYDPQGLFEVVETKYPVTRMGFKQNRNKVCIYTTLFGDIDNLHPIFSIVDGVDHICFTDQYRHDVSWHQIVVKPEFSSMNLSAKQYKILPHKYLEKYEYSLFVDANTVFCGSVEYLLALCLAAGDFIMWRHPFRRDVSREVVAVITSKRHQPAGVLNQLKDYRGKGLPFDSGLTEGSFIWRSHRNVNVCDFMDAWWHEINRYSFRDQISLGYLMWHTGTRPKVLSDDLGNSRENHFFFKAPHNFERNLQSNSFSQTKKKKICFLYADLFVEAGSTVMRGFQLSNLVSNYFAGALDVTYESIQTQPIGSLVILTKGALKVLSQEQLIRLKDDGNVLVADFVDDRPYSNVIEFLDGIIASSISAYKYCLNAYPNKPVFHITHHVDPRIFESLARYNSKLSTLHIGYFGELLNTVYLDTLSDSVDFISVDTSKQKLDWIDLVPNYNCHYSVRQQRDIDGFKPFLKGFTAAACGANIIVSEDQGDALYYLGPDYPYLLRADHSESDVIELVSRMYDTFNGADWNMALDIMREVKVRSSNDVVLREFDNMVKFFL
jgi:hypothetical protein